MTGNDVKNKTEMMTYEEMKKRYKEIEREKIELIRQSRANYQCVAEECCEDCDYAVWSCDMIIGCDISDYDLNKEKEKR